MKRRHLRADTLEAISGFLFASPVILGLLVWVIAPMVGVLLISLTDWNVLTTPRWVGFRNYVKLFTADLYFWNTLKVTAYYVLLIIDAIHRKRIGMARASLHHDVRRNINEIGFESGYSDPGYFRRMFKRLTGLTPREFRSLYARTHINTH